MKILNIVIHFKGILTFLLISILGSCALYAQESETEMKNNLFFIIGQGYEDGLQSFSRMPTIGFGYERKLNDYFSFYTRILSFYRPSLDIDSYEDVADFKNSPLVGINFKSKDNEIIPLKSRNSIKYLSLPLSVGIRFTPFRFQNHSLSIHLGWELVYETYNRWKDYLGGVIIYTDEGFYNKKEPHFNTITLQTEHHHIVTGEQIGFSYQYDFNKSSLALYFGENYGFLGPTSAKYFYELSLMYKVNF